MLLATLLLLAPPATADTVRVAGQPSNHFRPSEALGAGIDRLSSKIVEAAYAPGTLAAVLSAGWGPVSYRLNTELHIEAWH